MDNTHTSLSVGVTFTIDSLFYSTGSQIDETNHMLSECNSGITNE